MRKMRLLVSPILFLIQYPFTVLSSPAILLPSGSSDDESRFGYSIAAHEDDIIIGSFRGDAAYIFHREGGGWIQQARLTSGEEKTNNSFGYAVSINGNYALVSADSSTSQIDRTGSVYAFKREGSSWYRIDTLKASDGEALDLFGGSLAQSGNYAIIGAWQDNDFGLSSGSAYIFKLENDKWVQTT